MHRSAFEVLACQPSALRAEVKVNFLAQKIGGRDYVEGKLAHYLDPGVTLEQLQAEVQRQREVLVVAVVALVRIVRRSLAAANDSSKPAGCAGCPFDSKCEMQSKPHAEACGSEEDDS